MRNLLIRKYIIDIILVFTVVLFLTWFWFGPYKDKVRLRESLMANNISFNNNIKYKGFDSLNISNNIITKDLEVTNTGNESINFVISLNSIDYDKNNYINYIIIDNNNEKSSVRSLALDGYILENKINSNETKKYKIIMWTLDDLKLESKLDISLVPTYL